MSRGLSKIILIGNLGRDPEMKYTPQGTPVTTFSMAVGRVTKTQDGQTKEETDWYRVSAWRRLAEISNEYLHKGSRVYVEGRFTTREWQTPEGQVKTALEVEATELIMLDTKAQSEALGRSGGYEDRGPAGRGEPRFDDEGDTDPDDIPF